jgi:choline dehydrogenase-like flavoprotein
LILRYDKRSMGREQIFDAIVIGAGATGGWTAKCLTEAGLQVALLEAGQTTTEADFVDGNGRQVVGYTPPSRQVLERRPIQANCYACREPQHRWFVDDYENPYTQLSPFHWIRMRVLGGRLLAWEGQCYRMSDLDFKAADHDGYGDSWPISYRDLAPYYDKVEKYLRVTGVRQNLNHLPDGVYEVPSGNNVTYELLRDPLLGGFGRVVTPARLAQVSCQRNHLEDSRSISSSSERDSVQFSTPWLPLIDASATGRLSLLTDSIVTTVLSDGRRVTGVTYIDRNSRECNELTGRVVILCGSTLESTRLLLNSGICNSSGVLGQFLMDHILGGGAYGDAVVKRSDFMAASEQRHRVYIPRFRNVSTRWTDGFIRGYGFQGKSVTIPDENNTDTSQADNSKS